MSAPFTYSGIAFPSFPDGQDVYDTPDAELSMQQLAATGANSIELTRYIGQANDSSNSVSTIPMTESNASLTAAIQEAHSLGLTVNLKVMDQLGTGGSYDGGIDPTDPAAWFASYTAQVVQTAELAQQNGVEMLTIGTELESITGPAYESYWDNLIAQVRQVYSGKLTYAATVNEAQTVSFWNKLDYIGIDAYWSLTNSQNPTEQQLEAGWTQQTPGVWEASAFNGESPIQVMENLSAEYGKQVVFPEIGFTSTTGNAIQPYDYPSTIATSANSPGVNLQAQVDAWTATLTALEQNNGSDWLAGIYAWNWSTTPVTSSSSPEDQSWIGWSGYEINGKPAEQVFDQFYGGSGAASTGSTTASTGATSGSSSASGSTTSTSTAATSTSSTTSGANNPGAGPDSVTVHVSGDHWAAAPNGADPEFVVLVDGQQVGGVQTVSASLASGQWQDITVDGNFANPQQVQVEFVNDSYGGSQAQDVNLYVGSVTVNGHTFEASQAASNTASQGYSGPDANTAGLYTDGTLTFDVAGEAAAPTSGSTTSTGSTTSSSTSTTSGGSTSSAEGSVTVHVSGDQWAGAPNGADPEFVVLVDGQQVGGVQTVSASLASGQWQDVTVQGAFSDPHQVQVEFINDSYGGSHAEDVNLYVGSITVNGQTFTGSQAASNTASQGYAGPDANTAGLYTDGTLTFNIPTQTANAASGTSTAPASTSGTTMVPTFTDGAGHELFLFTSMAQTGADIAAFNPAQDVLDLVPLLKSIGYTGANPIAAHVVTLEANGQGGTSVMIDPTGQDPNHGTLLVTLDHVAPQDVHASNLWH